MKTSTNGICTWQFKYANTIPTVLRMSNGLICGYITGIHGNRIVTLYASCEICHNASLLSNILSADYFAIMYVADNP